MTTDVAEIQPSGTRFYAYTNPRKHNTHLILFRSVSRVRLKVTSCLSIIFFNSSAVSSYLQRRNNVRTGVILSALVVQYVGNAAGYGRDKSI